MIHEINPERIEPLLKGSTKIEVLRELTSLVSKNCPKTNEDQLFEILWEREMLGSTGIGDGIALPHGKIKSIERIEIYFGRSTKGVPFDSLDNKPVQLFFLLLAPLKSSAQYLRCLAQLSRFLKSPHIRSGLTLAEDRDKILEILVSAGELK